MIKFKFDNETIELPEKWEEVTVGLWTHPNFSAGDSLSMLSALSGLTPEQLANSTEDLSTHFVRCSRFIVANPEGWKGSEMPETLTLMDKVCTIPKDLNLELFGQKILTSQAMRAGALQAIPEAIAIYLAPQVYGSEAWFLKENLAELKEEIKKMPIASVWKVADFFLNKYQKPQKNGATD